MKVIMNVHGGLGDNLQKSTIPRMLAEQGNTVYLNYKHDDGFFHNDEIKQLVWDMNPYVQGFTEDAPTLIRSGSPTNAHNDFIKNWEAFHGLEPKNSYPEIYYKPKTVKGIDVAVELSWMTGNYTPETVAEMAGHLLGAYRNLSCVQILSSYQNKNVDVGLPKITVATIFDLTNILYSAKVIITLSSGSHMLAAALHRGTIPQFCIMPDWLPIFPHYVLPKIQYVYPTYKHRTAA